MNGLLLAFCILLAVAAASVYVNIYLCRKLFEGRKAVQDAHRLVREVRHELQDTYRPHR